MSQEADFAEWLANDANFRKVRNEVAKRLLYEVQTLQPVRCEHEASEEQLSRMLDHIERVWSAYGVSDPHWSVVVSPRFRRDSIQNNTREFYELGKRENEALSLLLGRLGIVVPSSAEWLEYGCGVGRVTRWLATRAERVTGVDISADHLKLAREYCSTEGVENIDWVNVKNMRDVEALGSFDVLYSKIVLQHNPPPIVARILDILLSKVRDGGIAIFQVPTYKKNYEFIVEKYLDSMDSTEVMEMHILPQRVVFDILDKFNFVPVEVLRDHLVSQADYISSTFVARRR